MPEAEKNNLKKAGIVTEDVNKLIEANLLVDDSNKQ